MAMMCSREQNKFDVCRKAAVALSARGGCRQLTHQSNGCQSEALLKLTWLRWQQPGPAKPAEIRMSHTLFWSLTPSGNSGFLLIAGRSLTI
jgi:hypothetical protein